jgi:hypothetical protein
MQGQKETGRRLWRKDDFRDEVAEENFWGHKYSEMGVGREAQDTRRSLRLEGIEVRKQRAWSRMWLWIKESGCNPLFCKRAGCECLCFLEPSDLILNYP